MQAPVLQRKFGACPRKPTIPTSATSATSAHGRRGPEDGFVSPGQPAQAHLQPVQMHGEAERQPDCRESARAFTRALPLLRREHRWRAMVSSRSFVGARSGGARRRVRMPLPRARQVLSSSPCEIDGTDSGDCATNSLQRRRSHATGHRFVAIPARPQPEHARLLRSLLVSSPGQIRVNGSPRGEMNSHVASVFD